MLRCLTGHKYPLGVSHTSLQHLEDKTMDSLLSIPHKDFRRTLAGLLDMSGDVRIANFRALPADIDQYPYTLTSNPLAEEREFKNTTFIPAAPKHVLRLPLLSPGSMSPINPDNGYGLIGNGTASGLVLPRSRSQSRDRLAAHFAAGLELSDDSFPTLTRPGCVSPPRPQTGLAANELLLLNPACEPAMRAISFVKYALRCAGILYHVQPAQASACTAAHPTNGQQADLSQDLPQVEAPKLKPGAPIMHCIQVLPKEIAHPHSAAANQLMTIKLRPALSRAQTAAAASSRSPSAPPASSTAAKGKKGAKASEPAKIRCLEFWIQIIPVYIGGAEGGNESRRTSPKTEKRQKRGLSRSRTGTMGEERKCSKLRIRVSDEAAIPFVSKALSVTELAEDGGARPIKQTSGPARIEGNNRRKVLLAVDPEEEEQVRGRPKLSRSASSGEQEMGSRRDFVRSAGLTTTDKRSNLHQGRPHLSRAYTEAPVNTAGASAPVRTDSGPMSDPDSSKSPIEQTTTTPLPAPTSTRSKSSRGFFDLVGFARPRATAGPYTAANTPAPIDEASSTDSLPATPNPLTFAAL